MRLVERYFEDYTIGESKTSWGRTITESDIITHAGQTGDWFPHHVDAEWCSTQPFKHRIAHGTLILAVAVGQTADEINPLSQSYGYDRVRFVNPVFIADTITSTLEVSDLRPHAQRRDAGSSTRRARSSARTARPCCPSCTYSWFSG